MAGPNALPHVRVPLIPQPSEESLSDKDSVNDLKGRNDALRQQQKTVRDEIRNRILRMKGKLATTKAELKRTPPADVDRTARLQRRRAKLQRLINELTAIPNGPSGTSHWIQQRFFPHLRKISVGARRNAIALSPDRRQDFDALLENIKPDTRLNSTLDSDSSEQMTKETTAPADSALPEKGKAPLREPALQILPLYEENIPPAIEDIAASVTDASSDLGSASNDTIARTEEYYEQFFQIRDSNDISASELDTAAQVAAVVRFGYSGKKLSDVQAEVLGDFGIHSDWREVKLPDDVHQQVLEICPKKLDDGRYYDPDSAMMIYIARNSRTGQIMLANPGTTAGVYKGGALRRVLWNRSESRTQWIGTNIPSLQGQVPDSYKKAAQLAAVLKNWCEQEGRELILAGHSKGAAELGYAALDQNLKAFCFSAPAFGLGILSAFSPEKLATAKKYIKLIFIDGDPVSSHFLNGPTRLTSLLQKAIPFGSTAYVGDAYIVPPSDKVVGFRDPTGLYLHENAYKILAAAAERHKDARQIAKLIEQESAALKTGNWGTGNLRPPAQALGINEDILINASHGLQSRLPGSGQFENVLMGTHKDKATTYLYTVDERGVNVVLEKTPFRTARGNVVHSNISSQASIGGEIWFGPNNTVTINAGSGRFGDRAGITVQQWEATVELWESLGYKVNAVPFGSR